MMTRPKNRSLLIVGLIVALMITLIFGLRLAGRLAHRPLREPIRPWMSVPQIAHANHVPPEVLFEALGLPATHPPDLRPIAEIARTQNRSVEEVIRLLEEQIQRDPSAPSLPERSQ